MAVQHISDLSIELPTLTFQRKAESPYAEEIRHLLRDFSNALLTDAQLPVFAQIAHAATTSTDEEGMTAFRLRASVPIGGFQRTDVTRLVLTFGRLDEVTPVRLGIFLDPVESPVEGIHPPNK